MKNVSLLALVAMLFVFVGAGCADEKLSVDNQVEPDVSQENIVPEVVEDGKPGDVDMSDEVVSYEVDLEESNLEWKGSALVKSHKGFVVLSEGTLDAKGTELVSGSFIIDMGSIACTDLDEAGAESLVGHLKADDFFGVEKYPTAKFELTSSVAGEKAGEYIFVGDLTIKGITKEVDFPAEVKLDEGKLTAKGTFSLDRTEWKIKFGSGKFFDDLGDKAIDDMIEFTLNLSTK